MTPTEQQAPLSAATLVDTDKDHKMASLTVPKTLEEQARDLAGTPGAATRDEARVQLQEKLRMKTLRKEMFLTSERGEIDWKTEIDVGLYAQVDSIARTVEQLGNKIGATETLRQTQKMLQEIIGELRARDKLGEQRFRNPEEVTIAMAVIYQHELMVAHALGRNITNNGQREGTLTISGPEELGKEKTHETTPARGFDLINPKLISLLHRAWGGVGGAGTWAREVFWQTPGKETIVHYGIGVKDTGYEVISPYVEKLGVQGWPNETTLKHLRQLETLRLDVYEALGMDLKVDDRLAQIDMEQVFSASAATGGEAIFNLALQDARKTLLAGRGYDTLTPAERVDLDLHAVDLAAQDTCETVANALRNREVIEKGKGEREADRLGIQKRIEGLETGKDGQDAVRTAIEDLTRQKEEADTTRSRWEAMVGKLNPDGTRTAGIFDTAKTAYEAAQTAAIKAEGGHTKRSARYGDETIPTSDIGKLKTEYDAIPGLLDKHHKQIEAMSGEIVKLRADRAIAAGKWAADQKNQVLKGAVDDIDREIGAREARMAEYSSQAKDTRARQAAIPQQINAMLAELDQLLTAHETAQETLKRTKATVEAMLTDFGQALGDIDNAAARDALIVAKKAEIRAKQKEIEEKQKLLKGEPDDKDLAEAARYRAIHGLTECSEQQDTYNAVVGTLDAVLATRIADERNEALSHEAVCEAVMDHVKFKGKVKQPKAGDPTGAMEIVDKDRELTMQEQMELFTRGEVVMVAMESFGIPVDKLLAGGPEIGDYSDRLTWITDLRNQIQTLESKRGPNWERDRQANLDTIKVYMRDNMRTLAKHYKEILPYFRRNLGGDRDFSRNAIRYLMKKAAAGDLYTPPYVAREIPKPGEEFKARQVPIVEVGQAEIHPINLTLEPGEQRYEFNTLGVVLTTPTNVNVLIDTEVRPKGLVTNIRIRRDAQLWRQLQGFANRGLASAAGFPAAVLDAAYGPGGGLRPIEQFADNGYMAISTPAMGDFNSLITQIGTQLGAPLGPDITHLYPAAVARMVLEMPPAQRNNIMDTITALDLQAVNLPSLSPGHQLTQEGDNLFILDPAGKRILISDFIDNYQNLFRVRKGIGPAVDITPADMPELQRELTNLYDFIGYQVLAAIQKKSQSK